MNFYLSNSYNLLIFAVLALTPPIFAEEVLPKIFEIESLCQISANQPNKTLFLFDIDDTIFDSPSMLGSKAWRKYISEAAGKIDQSENWHDIISYELAKKHPLTPVEIMTSSFVKDLQERGYGVCGLTARERNIWYYMPQEGVDLLTIKQLNSVGVDFNNGSLENTYPELSQATEYFGGVFFADLEPKGNYLLKLFGNTSQFPEKIIFIDDKPSQSESVAFALSQLGIAHECYTYTATDEKAKVFDPLIANIQLYYFYDSEGKRLFQTKELCK